MADDLQTLAENYFESMEFYADEAMPEDDVDPLYDQPDELPEEDLFNALNDPVNDAALADVFSDDENDVYAVPEYRELYDHQPQDPPCWPQSNLYYPAHFGYSRTSKPLSREYLLSEPKRIYFIGSDAHYE